MSEASLQHSEVFLSLTWQWGGSFWGIPLWSHLLYVILHRTTPAEEMSKSYSFRSSLFEAVTQPAALLHWLSFKAKAYVEEGQKSRLQKEPFLKGEPFKVQIRQREIRQHDWYLPGPSWVFDKGLIFAIHLTLHNSENASSQKCNSSPEIINWWPFAQQFFLKNPPSLVPLGDIFLFYVFTSYYHLQLLQLVSKYQMSLKTVVVQTAALNVLDPQWATGVCWLETSHRIWRATN